MFVQRARRRSIPIQAMSLVLGGFVVLALASGAHAGQPATATLNPEPADFYSCIATGGGTICQAHTVDVYANEPTGIVCGTGADVVDLLDSGIRDVRATRWYDSDGNLTRRNRTFLFRDAYLTSPATGDVLPYSQHNTDSDVLDVPGDLNSATVFSRGHLSITARGFGIVLGGAGRSVMSPGGDLIAESGLSLFDADSLCAALGTPNA